MARRSRPTIDGSRFTFDLRKLEVFIAVCEAGSMAGAAKMLQISQPAVSQAIAELEAAFRCRLFDRQLRPIALTPGGNLVRQHARSVLAEAQQILPALQRSRQAKLPLLRIGMGPSLAGSFGPILARSMHDKVSQVTICSGLSPSMTTELFSRELDIVIVVDEFDHSEGVERIELLVEPYVVIVPHDYGGPEPITIDALLADLPLVRLSARSQSGSDVDRQLRRLRREAPRFVEFDEPQGLTQMVALGAGWAVTTPLCIMGAKVDMERIRVVPFPGPAFGRTLTLLYRRRELGDVPRMIAQTVRRFVEEDCMPQLLQAAPWLKSQVKLLKPGPVELA
jgi:DNA-binding transcriptional LysR family regulator